ncbi:hypothetical protein B0H19DRAFT_940473 [Mycena capillaripes]|nr:hypothetical protein B0H19DRAFT_940473 [Mycena capillaripes]
MGAKAEISHGPSKLHGLQDRSLILQTSGTSGKKKVVSYTLLSLIVGTCAAVESWGLRSRDKLMPLLHVGGIVRNLLAICPVFSGGSSIVSERFDPIVFWTLDERLQPTWCVTRGRTS